MSNAQFKNDMIAKYPSITEMNDTDLQELLYEIQKLRYYNEDLKEELKVKVDEYNLLEDEVIDLEMRTGTGIYGNY